MSLLINGKSYSSFHFIGILGCGMSAIAQYLRWASCTVTGSDRLSEAQETKHIRDKLANMGCRLFAQDGQGITCDTDAVVVSTAIESSNPDIVQARRFSIPVFHRSDVLASIVKTKKTIAVAGTSGKSTVSALLYHLLCACGKKPSLITGANLHALVKDGFIGNAVYDSSDILIIEADESDGSCVKYNPFMSVFLNVSKDHKPLDETISLFKTLAAHSHRTVINHQCLPLHAIPHETTFGLSSDADFYPDSVDYTPHYVSMTKDSLSFTIPFPGKHMAYNLTAALSVCEYLGCDRESLSKACASYSGIERRFDRMTTGTGITIIDDYAHNPEKILAAITTVQSLSDSVFVLFQPHGFAPTKFMFPELVTVFDTVFRETDTLILLPIYYAGGTAAKDISSQHIADALKRCKATVVVAHDRIDILPYLKQYAQSGNVILLCGARDPSLPLFYNQIVSAVSE